MILILIIINTNTTTATTTTTTTKGVYFCISHGHPEDRIGHLEQYDLSYPGYTPWLIDVSAVAKPEQYDGEELDLDDPGNSYFLYVAKKQQVCELIIIILSLPPLL